MFKKIHLITLIIGLGFCSLSMATTLTINQFDTVESVSPNTTATSNILLTTTDS